MKYNNSIAKVIFNTIKCGVILKYHSSGKFKYDVIGPGNLSANLALLHLLGNIAVKFLGKAI